jgi:hypothetical protein
MLVLGTAAMKPSIKRGRKALMVARGEMTGISAGYRVGPIQVVRQRVAGGLVNVLD